MTQIAIMTLLIVCATIAYIFKLRLENRQLHAYILDLESGQNTSQPPLARPNDALEVITLPNAGQALKNPPTSLQPTLERLQGEYAIPLGWSVLHGRAELVAVQLKGDVNHVLLTGQSDSGKDNAALNILLSLALTHTPRQVQFAIIDGKGLDWIGWQHKAHTWHLAMKPEDVGAAMQKLTNERIDRYDRLARAKVKKWDSYTGGDMPMLVVFVSELLLLQNAVGKANLTSWLNAELTSARAAGIRYIIATQTASQFDTQWRSQISLFMAGYQPLDSQDKPNTGMSASEIAALGSVAPSALPAPASGAAGVFIALQGASALNVRTSYIYDDHADFLLRQLPDKRQNNNDVLAHSLNTDYVLDNDYVLADLLEDEAVESGAMWHSNAVKAHSEPLEAQGSVSGTSRSHDSFEALPISTLLIPEHEQKRIIQVAKKATSRRQVCKELYNSTGGNGYKNVATVCDALGLLMPANNKSVVMQ